MFIIMKYMLQCNILTHLCVFSSSWMTVEVYCTEAAQKIPVPVSLLLVLVFS